MKAIEIAARLKGISTPFGGASWDLGQPSVVTARKVIAFVEARRVLFSSYTFEVPQECVESVIEIRNYLSELIGASATNNALTQSVRALRRYCTQFLEQVGAIADANNPHLRARRLLSDNAWPMHDYEFGMALGQLRAAFGLQLASIAAAYKLDIDADLERLLPKADG